MQQPETNQEGDENADGHARRTNADDGEVDQQRAHHRADKNRHRNDCGSGHEKQTSAQNFDNASDVTKPLSQADCGEQDQPCPLRKGVDPRREERRREEEYGG